MIVNRSYGRLVCAILALLVLLACLNGCQHDTQRNVTCDEVIEAYEKAGYEVFHEDTQSEAYACHVKAWDGEQEIYFHFFDTAEAAEQYAQSNKWNVILWLYSVAIAQPYWPNVKAYGNVEYEYADKGILEPFRELIG